MTLEQLAAAYLAKQFLILPERIPEEIKKAYIAGVESQAQRSAEIAVSEDEVEAALNELIEEGWIDDRGEEVHRSVTLALEAFLRKRAEKP